MMSWSYYLDLRASKFGDIGRVLLHDPCDPAWPGDGRTTKVEFEAKQWVCDHYAAWLATYLLDHQTAPDEADLAVQQACERYLKDTAKRKGAEHHPVKDRASQIRQHIVPRLEAARSMLDRLCGQARSRGRRHRVLRYPACPATSHSASMSLEKLSVLVPFSQLASIDWATRIREAEGVEKRVFQCQELAIKMALPIEAAPTTAEKLAWCALWTRAFALLQAAADLRGTASMRVAELLMRPAEECWLQVQAIRHPWDMLRQLRSRPGVKVAASVEPRRWDEVASRLRAYLAWSLANDVVFARNRLRPRELQALYQPSEFVVREPMEQALHNFLFGEPEIINSAEAQLDRRRAEQEHETTVARLLSWLATPSLRPWSTKLAPFVAERDAPPMPTFFSFLEAEWTSVPKTLYGLGMPEIYASYVRGSLMLHGSTFEQVTTVVEDGAAQRLIFLTSLGTRDTETLCERLAEMADGALKGLRGLMPYCVPGAQRAQ